MAERIADINPGAKVEARCCFYLPENADEFDFSSYSYVVDAVDTVTAKLEIIQRAKLCGVPVISSMGAGNKTDPTLFRVSDLYRTSVCPLAKVMRRECRKRGIQDLKVVWSPEEPTAPAEQIRDASGKKVIPGSIAFVPSAAGLALASEVVRDLIQGT
jgi:tRNA A37 threonylcarbamoyladenosine dehydratase